MVISFTPSKKQDKISNNKQGPKKPGIDEDTENSCLIHLPPEIQRPARLTDIRFLLPMETSPSPFRLLASVVLPMTSSGWTKPQVALSISLLRGLEAKAVEVISLSFLPPSLYGIGFLTSFRFGKEHWRPAWKLLQSIAQAKKKRRQYNRLTQLSKLFDHSLFYLWEVSMSEFTSFPKIKKLRKSSSRQWKSHDEGLIK